MDYSTQFEVIVIGGGHAGTEAALAAARMGSSTLLLTHNIETLGQMSCNPAIGGIGKSHLVKEVDALGGAMAIATDHAGIQFRVLNSRKGPAVRATRAQADRALYKSVIRSILENQQGLSIFQQSVDDLLVINDQVCGVVTQAGIKFYAPTVVITTGTFLGGVIHIGLQNHSGGRAGDPPAISLAKRLRELPFDVGRLKTGTPPRIDAKTVDFNLMQAQPGDSPCPTMSYMGSIDLHPQQVCCYITHTSEETHDIIRSGLDRSPMYSGVIEGIGPRYCPSIEDKITRFADKSSHQIFIEPEGLHTHELYPNGISTSLPFDIQLKLVQSIRGLEQAFITRPGYAIEYDFLNPQDLKLTMETKYIHGLFLAGQINGTTGYEEAAAQGLLAGINASLKAQDKDGWYPRRDEAYIGVLMDDLVTMGTNEPYRMFTSRAEFRLLLREDNADLRLTERGRELGLIDDERWKSFCEKRESVEKQKQYLRDTWVRPNTSEANKFSEKLGQTIRHEYSLYDLLKRPEMDYETLNAQISLPANDKAVEQQVETQIKYEGYISRQLDEVEKLRKHENAALPENMNYEEVKGLSNEVTQKLLLVKPQTIGQASRISGVTPAAISLLLIHLKKKNQLKQVSGE